MTKSKEMTTNLTTYADGRELVIAGEEGHAILVEQAKAGNLTRGTLGQVTVPSGGSITWDIDDGAVSTKAIDCVVLGAVATRAWYRQSFEERDEPGAPECASVNLVDGWGDHSPGQDQPDGLGPHSCSMCPHSDFESDRKGGPGQDCSESRTLLVMVIDEALPTIIKLPATSLKGWRTYGVQLGKRVKRLTGVITRITLEKQMRGSLSYSVAKFANIGDVSADHMAFVINAATLCAEILNAPNDVSACAAGRGARSADAFDASGSTKGSST